MNEESALLRAVIAEPDNLDLRLIFADWYEDQGDPRAHFIRLQIALTRVSKSHPWRREFRRKANALWRRYGRVWNAPIYRRLNQTPLKGQVHARRAAVRGWEYRRGFIEVIQAEAEAFLHHGNVLLDLGPVIEARLFQVHASLNHLVRSPYLSRLQALDLRQNQLTADELAILLTSRHLRELRSLDLSQNHLGDLGAVLLSDTQSLPRLEQLYLWGEVLSEEPLLRLQARFGAGVHASEPYRVDEDSFERRFVSYDDHVAYEDGKALADGLEVDEFDPTGERRPYEADYDFEELIFRDEWEETLGPPAGRCRPDEQPADFDDDLYDDWSEPYD